MKDLIKNNKDLMPVGMKEIVDKIVTLRGKDVIADADVAFLYQVETKRVN